MIWHCYASCAFGIESVLARELKNLNFNNVKTRNARVYFDADETGIATANVWLRTADRVYIVFKEFEANTFSELYDGIREINFDKSIPSDAKIIVNGNSVKSTLKSVSAIQSISKKALADNLCELYHMGFLPETGNRYNIFINFLNNITTIALNTSGEGLNRRGYRTKNVAAPLRESLAAALVLLSRWGDRTFYDPMCGGGTIAIEAAMIAANIAPGLYRRFDAQSFNNEFNNAFKIAKENALYSIMKPKTAIYASDIESASIKISEEHARNAHVYEYINFDIKSFERIGNFKNNSTLITNPPYSIRLGEAKENEKLYRALGKTLWKTEDLKFYILCANDRFEEYFGHRSDKKRKLYNGNIRCTYYQYYKYR